MATNVRPAAQNSHASSVSCPSQVRQVQVRPLLPASMVSFTSLWLFVLWCGIVADGAATSPITKRCQLEPRENSRYNVHSKSDLFFALPAHGGVGFRSHRCRVAESRSVRDGISVAHASLEDREQDVAKIRDVTRGVVQDLLGVAASAAARRTASPQEEAIDVTAKAADKMVVGFVGTGTISEAVVKGMCASLSEAVEIVVSPRNAKISASLAAEFPSRVTVAADNQAVLDASDIVCIAVTPQVFEGVLSPLSFRDEHIIISFMSTVRIETLQPFVAPASSIVRMIPMPPIARCLGPLPIYPPLELVHTMFEPLGTVVALESEDEFAALMASSSLMAPFYNLQETVSQWIASKGIDPATSSKYVGALFHGISSDSLGLKEFSTITANSQTPKGINEQSLKQLSEAGFYSQIESQLDVIYGRVSGKP